MPVAETETRPQEPASARPEQGAGGAVRVDHTQRGAPSLAAHPRAARRVGESKAWGGLAGFALGGYLSLAHHTLADAVFRGLLAGVVCYVLVWAAAVFIWRRLIAAELNQAEHALIGAQVARESADHQSDIRRVDRESARD